MSGMTTQTNSELDGFLADTILITLDLLNDILDQINSIETFKAEREFHWNRQVSEFTSDISKFVEVTTLLSKMVMKQKNQTLPEIKNSHIHLLFVLKGIIQAQHKMDSVVLEDLIKYELKDNLTQWKIDLIPQTKRLLNS